jgi:PleD family two-component response regulator
MGSVVIDASGDVSPTTSSTFAAVPTALSSPRKNDGAGAQLVKSSSVELHRRKAEEKFGAASNEPKRPLILGNYSAKRTRTQSHAHTHHRTHTTIARADFGGKRTVVEDNKTNQKLLLQLLKRLGFVADVANDGLEAVEAWHKKKYDVIVRRPPFIIPRILVKNLN